MKVALCLTGLLREYQQAFESIKTNIMEPYGIKNEDIYISTWDEVGYWTAGDGLNKQGFESVRQVPLEELKEFYQTENIILEKFTEKQSWFESLGEYYKEFFIPEINHSNLLVRKKNTISMFYKIATGVQSIIDSGKQYDVIIRTRPDLCTFEALPVFGNYENFYSLFHRNHIGTGIGDNLHVSSTENMIKFAQAFNKMQELYEYSDKIFCPHLFSQNILNMNNISNVEFRLVSKYMHTPGGEYKVKDTDDQWKHLSEVNYAKFTGRFNGECGKGTESK